MRDDWIFPEPTKEEALREEILSILNKAFFGLGIGNYDKDKYVCKLIMNAVKKHTESE